MTRFLSHILLLVICLSLMPQASMAAKPKDSEKPATEVNCDAAPTKVDQPSRNTSRFEIGQCAQYTSGMALQPYDFTSKLVACIEGTVRTTTLSMMAAISSHFGWLTAVLATLVICFYGIRTAMGEKELLKRTSTLFIKLAFVVAFMNSLPWVVDAVFGALKQAMSLVVGGSSPWQLIDRFFGKLFGFGPDIAMFNGLIGLVGASLFSSKVGFSLFFFGVAGILNLIIFIMQLIYTYCLAFLTIGFLLCLSPVTIPLALFFYSERYFKKWCDIIVASILTPVMLFAFVFMFLNIFSILIGNIFSVIGGNDFKPYWRMNTPSCSWLMQSDPNANVMLQNISKEDTLPCIKREIKPPVQTNINPLVRNASDSCVARFATVDFGANDVPIMQRLSFAFITLWIFSSLMKSMVALIPEIAASIASVVSTRSLGVQSEVLSKLQGKVSQLQGKVGQMGGIGGGKGAGTPGQSFASQMGSMLGKRDK
jgi:type IV secretory pathway VirB6-like protein